MLNGAEHELFGAARIEKQRESDWQRHFSGEEGDLLILAIFLNLEVLLLEIGDDALTVGAEPSTRPAATTASDAAASVAGNSFFTERMYTFLEQRCPARNDSRLGWFRPVRCRDTARGMRGSNPPELAETEESLA